MQALTRFALRPVPLALPCSALHCMGLTPDGFMLVVGGAWLKGALAGDQRVRGRENHRLFYFE